MDKHKTATHDSSETSDVPQPNESDSTCPVCKKSFKSARIKDLHFKFNKKCNPARNMQKEKFTLGKSNIPKMKNQKEIKKTPQPEILLTPKLPVTANKNTDQEDIDLVAEGQEIEAFYQKSSPSKEKGIFSKCKTRTFLNFDLKVNFFGSFQIKTPTMKTRYDLKRMCSLVLVTNRLTTGWRRSMMKMMTLR